MFYKNEYGILQPLRYTSGLKPWSRWAMFLILSKGCLYCPKCSQKVGHFDWTGMQVCYISIYAIFPFGWYLSMLCIETIFVFVSSSFTRIHQEQFKYYFGIGRPNRGHLWCSVCKIAYKHEFTESDWGIVG